MSVIVILILASLAVATGFLLAFVWAVRAGQFDDTVTPALRPLSESNGAPSTGPNSASGPGSAADASGVPPRAGAGEGSPGQVESAK